MRTEKMIGAVSPCDVSLRHLSPAFHGNRVVTFAQGIGLFPAPTVIEKEVCRQYKVRVAGRTDAVRERYYAISVERRLKHPAVLAICETARDKIFA